MPTEIDKVFEILIGPDPLAARGAARRYPRTELVRSRKPADLATVTRILYEQYRKGTLTRRDELMFFRTFRALARTISDRSAISYEAAQAQIWEALA